jgi:outer membrane biosynthesis protein TonB
MHRGAGIALESLPARRDRILWGVGLSALLHLLLLIAAVTLLPGLARRFATPAELPKPDVLTFRFRDRTAEVDASSRVEKPPATPLTGKFNSQARDRVRDAHDTAIPAGAERSFENTLPGSEASQPSDAASGATNAPGATSRAAPQPAPTLDGVRADAIPSEVAMLTGRRQPISRPSSRGARSEAAEGEDGALQFGDYSFSTRAWDYEPYWYYMRERLYANWHPPAAYKDYGIIQGGWTLVRAVLDRQGHLINARIVGENGHASLHPASFAAMQGAAPFRPLPADFPEDSLVVTVRFIYMRPTETGPPATP